MGAWGFRTFEDDTSLDLVEEWMESSQPEQTIEDALRQALSQFPLDYDGGHVVAASAAVLDHALLEAGQEEDADLDGFQAWVGALSSRRLTSSLEQVVIGLDHLLSSESELCRLWSENTALYPSWRDLHSNRRDRLATLLCAS